MLVGFELSMRTIFSFPSLVNENSARLVAAGVVLQVVGYLLIRNGWLLAILALGFLARVLTGPTLSPLGQLVTRVLTPLVERAIGTSPKLVPGPPKRFAQMIGLVFSTTAGGLHFFGYPGWAMAVIGAIGLAATAESVFGYCLGCQIFGVAMKVGLVPETVCEACGDITARLQANGTTLGTQT